MGPRERAGAARPTESDDDLARSAAAGDREALERLLARHADRIHAICRRVLGSRDDALDATQEALISIARSITRFDGRASFTTWLYRVATNAAIDEQRRRSRRPRPSETIADTAAPGSIPDAVIARIDVDRALATVPEHFRVAVVLRDLAGLDYDQIARILEITPGTVRSRISRGRAALARALGGNPDPAPGRPTGAT